MAQKAQQEGNTQQAAQILMGARWRREEIEAIMSGNANPMGPQEPAFSPNEATERLAASLKTQGKTVSASEVSASEWNALRAKIGDGPVTQSKINQILADNYEINPASIDPDQLMNVLQQERARYSRVLDKRRSGASGSPFAVDFEYFKGITGSTG